MDLSSIWSVCSVWLFYQNIFKFIDLDIKDILVKDLGHKQIINNGKFFNIVCDISIFICFPFAFIHMFKFHFKRFNCWKVSFSLTITIYWYSCWCIFLGDIWIMDGQIIVLSSTGTIFSDVQVPFQKIQFLIGYYV